MKRFLFLFVSSLLLADPPIKIAYVGGRTGSHNSPSNKALKVLQMITAKYNKEGGIQGRQIVVTAFDTQGTAQGSVRVMKEIKTGGYLAIIGVHSSNDGLMLSKLAEESKIPLVVVSATHPDITKNKKYVVRTCFNDNTQGNFLADFSTRQLHLRRTIVITDVRDSFTSYLANVFQKRAKRNGAKIIASYSIKTNDRDFSEIIKNISNVENPDSIFMATSAMEAVYLMTQLNANNITLPIIGNDGWQNDDLLLALKTVPQTLPKAYFSVHWYKEQANSATQNFLRLYKRVNKESLESTDVDSVLMHDSAELLYRALTKVTSSGPTAIMAQLKATSFSGMTGKIKFTLNNEMQKDIFMLKISSGKLLPVKMRAE